MVMMILATETQGTLQINQITEESGYAQIKVREVEVVNQTFTVLHLVDTKELYQILNQVESNIKNLYLDNRKMIETEIRIVKSKLKSITPSEIRRKRGMFNFVGHAFKWLAGVMDDDDRQEILEHLGVIDENNHNTIGAVNKQIYINTQFNDSIQTLKSAVEEDRINIGNAFISFKNRQSEIIQRLLYTDQMFKLNYLKGKIEHIQDNIASTKNHIFHPSILTSEEIDKFEIDLFKLKSMKADILNYKDGILIIAIKIPIDYVQTDLKMITALPNKHYMEINEPNSYIIEIEHHVFTYEENVYLKNLKHSKHCTLLNNCNFRYNNATDIETFEDDMILIKNANNLEIIQDCDDRKLKINKNYLLFFYDCELKIKSQIFRNNKIALQDRYFYPNNNFSISNITPINFKQIELRSFENVKEIEELKVHKNISYGVNIVFVLVIVIILIVIIKSRKNVIVNKIKIKNKPETEDLELKEIKEKYGLS